jgi:hypothetical protein
MEAIDQLSYTSDTIPESIPEAAGDAAAQCGYDQFEEVLLDYEIVGIRRVSAQSVKDHYGAWLQPPCSFSPDEIVRVDWQTWAVPKRFDNTYEKAVIARAESIVVAVTTLMAREVFTYGLGPEYNWLEWQEGAPPAGEPSESTFKALGDLIVGDWLDDVREDADGQPGYLDRIHPSLKAAVAEAIADRDEPS